MILQRQLYICSLTTLCLSLIAPMPGLMAAANSDDNWPCIQRRVNELSIGQMWPESSAEHTDERSLFTQKKTQLLISQLASRRVSIQQAKQLVSDFATEQPMTAKQDWELIFKDVLRIINDHRKRIIQGIERYTASQQLRTQRIAQLRTDLNKAMTDTTPDHDKIDNLEESLDWSERIYRDREKSLTYVCESPVLLEKRAFAIAKILLQHARDDQ